MKTQIDSTSVRLWLFASDTYVWSRRPGNHWPCSSTVLFPLTDRK